MMAFPGEVHIRSATKLYIQSAHKIRLSVADPKLGGGGGGGTSVGEELRVETHLCNRPSENSL